MEGREPAWDMVPTQVAGSLANKHDHVRTVLPGMICAVSIHWLDYTPTCSVAMLVL